MGIKAHTNAADGALHSTWGESRPDYVKTQTKVDGSSSKSVSGASKYLYAQYCSREANEAGPWISVPNSTKKIRGATGFDRFVHEATTMAPYTHKMVNTKASRQTDVASNSYVGYVGEDTAGVSNNLGSSFFSGHSLRPWTEGINEARANCLNKIQDSKCELGTSLAEARSTLDMLSGAAAPILKALGHIKRREFNLLSNDLKKSLRFLDPKTKQFRDYYSGKTSANAYLQLSYGWLPLIGEAEGAYDMYQSLSDRPMTLDATGTSFRDWSLKKGWFSGNVRHRYTCSIRASVRGDYLRSFNQLGLVNPLAVAWEVVPYSFLIDWAVPIGNVLQSVTAGAGLSFVTGYENFVLEADVNQAFGSPFSVPTDWSETSRSDGSIQHRYFRFNRSRLTSFPLVGLYGKQNWLLNRRRGEEPTVNTSKVLQASALWRQLF